MTSQLVAEEHVFTGVAQGLHEMIGKVEEMFGHVAEANGAQQLMERHRQLESTNAQAQQELHKLDEQKANLSLQLAEIQQAIAEENRIYNLKEQAMQAQLEQRRATLQALRAQTDRVPGIQLYRAELKLGRTQRNDIGLSQRQNVEQELGRGVADASQEFATIHANIQRYALQGKRLKKAMTDMHKWNVDCHRQATQLKKDIAAKSGRLRALNTFERSERLRADDVSNVSAQGLLAEHALLQAELQRVDAEADQGLELLANERANLSALQRDVVKELDSLGADINASVAQDALLHQKVQETVNLEGEEEGRKRGLQSKLRELHKRLSPINFAALTAENSALHAELQQALVLLSRSKAEEARALAEQAQTEAAAEAQKHATKMAEEAALSAQNEGYTQLREIAKKATASRAKAEKEMTKANMVVAKKCRTAWNKHAAEMDEKVKVCRQHRDQLSVLQAQQSSLSQALSAEETANSVEQAQTETVQQASGGEDMDSSDEEAGRA